LDDNEHRVQPQPISPVKTNNEAPKKDI